MAKIQWHSSMDNSIVSFLIDGIGYSYRWLDGLAVEKINDLKDRRPGEALNIAKKHAHEVRKGNGPWCPVVVEKLQEA